MCVVTEYCEAVLLHSRKACMPTCYFDGQPELSIFRGPLWSYTKDTVHYKCITKKFCLGHSVLEILETDRRQLNSTNHYSSYTININAVTLNTVYAIRGVYFFCV